MNKLLYLFLLVIIRDANLYDSLNLIAKESKFKYNISESAKDVNIKEFDGEDEPDNLIRKLANSHNYTVSRTDNNTFTVYKRRNRR